MSAPRLLGDNHRIWESENHAPLCDGYNGVSWIELNDSKDWAAPVHQFGYIKGAPDDITAILEPKYPTEDAQMMDTREKGGAQGTFVEQQRRRIIGEVLALELTARTRLSGGRTSLVPDLGFKINVVGANAAAWSGTTSFRQKYRYNAKNLWAAIAGQLCTLRLTNECALISTRAFLAAVGQLPDRQELLLLLQGDPCRPWKAMLQEAAAFAEYGRHAARMCLQIDRRLAALLESNRSLMQADWSD
ncbi:unnamed protein product [Prorocentrum cordatum]|uniref:Uncharacterized protein n=1 Tax=Prorocentrum cordatum TaxID=2364126 RepID=A0ABN9QFS2_9DINO|nr:unnamed protein product [Polarella glacialis]